MPCAPGEAVCPTHATVLAEIAETENCDFFIFLDWFKGQCEKIIRKRFWSTKSALNISYVNMERTVNLWSLRAMSRLDATPSRSVLTAHSQNVVAFGSRPKGRLWLLRSEARRTERKVQLLV